MTQPIYFLPNVPAAKVCDPMTGKLDRKVLAANGLAEIFADVTAAECSCQDTLEGGPGNLVGCLLSYQTTAGELPQFLGYYPERQTWTNCGKFWIGYETANPPKESDLRRKRRFPGYDLETDSGEKWQIPIIRRPDDSTELPSAFSHSPDGKLVETPKSPYIDFWHRSAKVCSWFFNEDEVFGGSTFSKSLAVDMAIEAVSLNYRFGQAEQGITGLIDSTNFATVLGFSVDYPRFFSISRAEKKSSSQPTTPSTTTGQMGESQATDLVVQTSI